MQTVNDVTRHTSTPHPPSGPNYLGWVPLSYFVSLTEVQENSPCGSNDADGMYTTQNTVSSGNDSARNIDYP